jgi:signal transduction histidine kinase
MDPKCISQAIKNLLGNAIKFSQIASEITIGFRVIASLEGVNIPAHVKELSLKPGAYGIITVADRGIDIDPNKLNRIFDRFYQIDNADKRPGLNIVKNIVELHGGAVWAQSEGAEKRTVFTLALPA